MSDENIKLVTELVPLGEKTEKQLYNPSGSASPQVEEVTISYLALVETKIRLPSAAFTMKSPIVSKKARDKMERDKKYPRQAMLDTRGNVDYMVEASMSRDTQDRNLMNRKLSVTRSQRAALNTTNRSQGALNATIRSQGGALNATIRSQGAALNTTNRSQGGALNASNRSNRSEGGSEHPILAKMEELVDKVEAFVSKNEGSLNGSIRSQGGSPNRSQGGSPNRSQGGLKSKWGNSRLNNLGYDAEAPSTPKAGPSRPADDDDEYVGAYYPKSNYMRPLTPSPKRPGESEIEHKLRQWIEHPRKLFRRYLEKREILRQLEEAEGMHGKRKRSKRGKKKGKKN